MVTEAVFVLAMASAAVSDVFRRRIPNFLNMGILALGLGVRALTGGTDLLVQGLVGAVFGLLLLIVPFALRFVGGGDVKLCAAMGAWLGPGDVLTAVLFGVAGGGLLALAVLSFGGAELRAQVKANFLGWWITGAKPEPGKRSARQTVPLAVSLGAAAVGTFIVNGGIRV
jgi:prepilin peptidase CpaA